MRPNNNGDLNPRDVWRTVDEIGSAHHFIVWLTILEAERDEVERINSTTVIQQMQQWTGNIPSSDRVLRSMNRLEEFGILERERVESHPTACHWTTTETGREFAQVIAKEWVRTLELAAAGSGEIEQ